MKPSAIAWATVKALILALAATLAVAFLFAGISEFGAWAFETRCEQWMPICRAFRFWSAWWFFIFGVICAPLWIGLFIYFLRLLVRPGYRLAAVGYFLALQGAIGVLVVLAYYLGADIDGTNTEALANLAVSIVMLSIGLVLSRPKRRAS